MYLTPLRCASKSPVKIGQTDKYLKKYGIGLSTMYTFYMNSLKNCKFDITETSNFQKIFLL